MRRLTFSAVLEKSGNKLWGSHLVVPDAIARKVLESGSRRIVCTLNGSADHQCALLSTGGNSVISVNKKLCDSLGITLGSKVRVTLRQDESRYGLPLPAEWNEMLRQDSEAARLFRALTPGKQRTLLYLIGSVTKPEVRVWRATVVARHLRDNNGQINYKQLYASIRKPAR